LTESVKRQWLKFKVELTSMARITGWLGELVQELNWGCENSPYIRNLEGDTLQTGRELCLVLWPFISQLPANVGRVRSILPDDMTAAQKFFDQLKDDERFYQGLYLQQCTLTGVDKDTLLAFKPDDNTHNLCNLMQQYCASPDYHDGVLAIVAAELAATCFARHSLERVESYFGNLPESELRISLDEGLAWLRLHAKPHPKHALWLMRTIEAIDSRPPSNKMPQPVVILVEAIHQFLRSNKNGPRISHTKLVAPVTDTVV
jgi:pyrroloquinoline quinone (PQQ) biosynthesis protein C